MEGLQVDLKLESISVTIVTGGTKKIYTLRELTGSQRDEYLSTFDLDIEVVEGKARVKSGEKFKTFPAVDFLAMCLFDEESKPVPKEEIANYPGRVVSQLHSAALKLSGLDKESEEASKNG